MYNLRRIKSIVCPINKKREINHMAMKYPVTSAIRMLRQEKADFTEYQYKYEDKGGTMVSARELGVDEHLMIKTIVLEDEKKRPFIVLMHGDLQIPTLTGLGFNMRIKSSDFRRTR